MDFTHSKKHSNLTLLHNKKEDQEYVKHDFVLDLRNTFKHINRSNSLMILDKENRYEEIYVMSDELTNICIFILYSNLLHELNELVSKERNLIEHSYNKSGIIFNNVYSKINKRIFRYKLIFNEISESNGYFTEPYLKEHFEYLNKYYKEVLDKHSLIENASKDKINISNYNVSFWLSIISIVISIIAFITSLFYDSSPNYNNEINKIQQEQKNIYMELTDIYNEEKDLNRKLTNIIN